MLDNDKLNKRLKNIFKYLRKNWGIKLYRIAVETGIPYSSLKYMVDSKFEWKLNHLLFIIDFLNRYGAKISLKDLLDFKNKKSLSQIMNTKNANFREANIHKQRGYKKPVRVEKKLVDFKVESKSLAEEITDAIKDTSLFKNSKITVGLKVSGKNFDFQKSINFVNGKITKK
jgi:hypothetical protein